jgi:hypothetical protein
MSESASVRDLINDPRRIGVLATTDRAGNPNVAVFGSPHMPDDVTLLMGLAESRTAQNLLETGKASFLSVVPGANPMETKGARIYLKVRVMEKDGPNLEAIKEKIASVAGARAASRIKYAVFFDILSTRPLIDWTP